MSEREQNFIVYPTFALIFAICTLIVIRWGIDFINWAGIDPDWVQALGVPIAILIALAESRRAKSSEKKREQSADQAVLAGLRDLANELSLTCSMCRTSPDGVVDGVRVHADYAAHFELLASMIATVSVDRLAIHGHVRMMFVLHRVALNAKALIDEGNLQDVFMRKANRNKFMVYADEANAIATSIGEVVDAMDKK